MDNSTQKTQNTSTQANKENEKSLTTKTLIHGYLKHVVPNTLQGRHPYRSKDFKKRFQSPHITTPVSDQIISKMKSNRFQNFICHLLIHPL